MKVSQTSLCIQYVLYTYSYVYNKEFASHLDDVQNMQENCHAKHKWFWNAN